MSQNATVTQNVILNGFDLGALAGAAEALAADPRLAPVRFSARTHWTGGASTRTEIASYDLAGETIARRHTIHTDEPVELLGGNAAPNPQDLLLAALASCMMFGFAVGCSKRGIVLESLSIDTELTLDLRGPFGLDPAIPAGAESIRYTIRAAGSGTREQFEEVHADVIATSPNRYHLASPIKLESRLVVG